MKGKRIPPDGSSTDFLFVQISARTRPLSLHLALHLETRCSWNSSHRKIELFTYSFIIIQWTFFQNTNYKIVEITKQAHKNKECVHEKNMKLILLSHFPPQNRKPF